MAIQFPCPGCSQPIEVDDIYAEKAATCPYCRKVVTVPARSVLPQIPPIPARPAIGGTDERSREAEPTRSDASFSSTSYYQGEGLHIGPAPSYRERLARSHGNYALICTALVASLMMGTFIYGMILMSRAMQAATASQPADAPIDVNRLAENLAVDNPALAAGPLGALFFAVAGIVFSAISLKYAGRGNWRGKLSLGICGVFVFCFCAINAFALFGGMLP